MAEVMSEAARKSEMAMVVEAVEQSVLQPGAARDH